MALNVSQKLIQSHLLGGEMLPGEMIGIRIDQTLTQDATGTLVMLELEAMELKRVRTEVSVQYVDHNLIQADFRNPDDHLKDLTFTVRHTLFPRRINVVPAGGLTNWTRDQTPIQTSSTVPMKNDQSGIV